MPTRSAIGERSSRRIERRCLEDVATRVICANQALDHCTIARFRQRRELAIGELFGDVLALCVEAGLVRVGVVAIDGTKVHASASQHATRDYEQIAREILEEAGRVDAEEDEQFGERRGDELPPELATAQGRRGWLREAKHRLEEQRAEEARPIPRSRPERLKESKRRLEEEHDVECRANAAYEAYRARGVMKDGRRFGQRARRRVYAKRQGMIEPIFAHTKFNRRIDRFQRRGRAATRSEWRLITATHNLCKLWKHTSAPMAT
jgi:hypothetical protein